MGNDPVNNIDPSGGAVFDNIAADLIGGAAIGFISGLVYGAVTGNKSPLKTGAIGAGLGVAVFASIDFLKGAPQISVKGVGKVAEHVAGAAVNIGTKIADDVIKQPEANPYAKWVDNPDSKQKTDLPFTDDQFNKVYNNGHPYSYKPCDEPIEDGKPPFNQCAIRFSKALIDLGVDMSTCSGAHCKHGFLRVKDVIKFLKRNYKYVEVDANPRFDFGILYRRLSEAIDFSSIVVMMDYKDSDGTIGDHIEFLYKGSQKSPYINTWETARKFFIFDFTKVK